MGQSERYQSEDQHRRHHVRISVAGHRNPADSFQPYSNNWEEDMNDQIEELAPFRWKVGSTSAGL